MTVRVIHVDAEPNGLAEMLARLIEANLERDPRRASSLRRAVVELESLDAAVEATVRLSPGVVEVSNGRANPSADVRIRASSRDLADLSAVPLRLGLPDPLRRDGRTMLVRVLRGRVRISGLLRHPMLVARFSRLLSVT